MGASASEVSQCFINARSGAVTGVASPASLLWSGLSARKAEMARGPLPHSLPDGTAEVMLLGGEAAAELLVHHRPDGRGAATVGVRHDQVVGALVP
jgi:hypothetical protein